MSKNGSGPFYLRPNRYTGKSLFEDHQFVMLGILNEVSYNYHPQGLTKLNTYYTDKLKPVYKEYLARNGLADRPLDLSLNDDTSAAFWNEVMAKGYRMWRDFARSLGYRGVVSGSNVGENLAYGTYSGNRTHSTTIFTGDTVPGRGETCGSFRETAGVRC